MVADGLINPCAAGEPCTLKLYVPVEARPVETVTVLDALPFGPGVTDAGEALHDMPEGRPAQPTATALSYPPVEFTVQVVVVLPPWMTVRLEGVQATVKLPAVGVARAQLLVRPKQAEDAPAATTL
jgi:hypothetical protein